MKQSNGTNKDLAGFSYFDLNAATVDPKNTWFAFSMTDPIIMASMLALTGTFCILNGSLTDSRIQQEVYRQKYETIRMVNYRLQIKADQTSDAMIASIATLVNIDVSLRPNSLSEM